MCSGSYSRHVIMNVIHLPVATSSPRMPAVFLLEPHHLHRYYSQVLKSITKLGAFKGPSAVPPVCTRHCLVSCHLASGSVTAAHMSTTATVAAAETHQTIHYTEDTWPGWVDAATDPAEQQLHLLKRRSAHTRYLLHTAFKHRKHAS